jgi:hypothetical protein
MTPFTPKVKSEKKFIYLEKKVGFLENLVISIK